jgi:sensor histidine kinase YesM
MKKSLLWLSYGIFAGLVPLLHVLILLNSDIRPGDAWIEIIVTGILCGLFMAGTGFAIRTAKPGISRFFTLTLGNLILANISLELSRYILNEFFATEFKLLQLSNLPYYFPVMLIFLILQLFGFFIWIFQLSAERLEDQKRRTEEQEMIRQAELSELRQQLQPHFLFNSLNSIQSLLQFDPAGASRMIQTLADFLRGSVNKSGTQLRFLDEEIHHIKLYLEIETIRFEDRLRIEFQIPENTHKILIPSLMLQPLIENAIKFGLYGNTGSITIHIRAETTNEYLKINISNPYDSEGIFDKKGTGFGLNSVRRRMQLLYNRNDLLKINKSENLFIVELIIPVK